MSGLKSERIQKFIARCGICSRRAAEKLIEEGKVKVNGRICKIGQQIDPKFDVVSVSGQKLVAPKENNIYVMLNKPRGYVTTMSDEIGRKCVADLVQKIPERIYPVGRLDKDSEGMLILTNDGKFANSLMHPKFKVQKTYRVIANGVPEEAQLEKIRNGIKLEDGMTMPADCFIQAIRPDGVSSVMKITITEGRNRQIRRMCEAVGLEIRRLKREAIGKLSVGTLPTGKFRILKQDEVDLIFKKSVDL